MTKEDFYEKINEKEESWLKKNIEIYFSSETVKWIEEMIEKEKYKVVENFFEDNEMYVVSTTHNGRLAKELYIHDKYVDIWVL